jgi:type IV secretory pathway VirB2 component (pilin)
VSESGAQTVVARFNAMPKRRQSAIVWGAALAAATIISFANPDPAYAQNLESFASKVRGLLSSTLLRTLAVIAVIVTGLALVHRSRFDRGAGHGDHRDRHCLFGGCHCRRDRRITR